MQLDLANPDLDFDTYCDHAQIVARGVEAMGKERKAAAETKAVDLKDDDEDEYPPESDSENESP